MCTHTRTCTCTGTLHRVRGLHVQPFPITPPCGQPHSIFGGCIGKFSRPFFLRDHPIKFRWSFVVVDSCWGGLPSGWSRGWSSIRVVSRGRSFVRVFCLEGGLPSGWSSFRVVSTGRSSIRMVCLEGGLSRGWSV